MRVFVNDQAIDVGEGADIVRILESMDIQPDRRGIAVAVNEHVVRRADWRSHAVADGDRIEVIQATQGG